MSLRQQALRATNTVLACLRLKEGKEARFQGYKSLRVTMTQMFSVICGLVYDWSQLVQAWPLPAAGCLSGEMECCRGGRGGFSGPFSRVCTGCGLFVKFA